MMKIPLATASLVLLTILLSNTLPTNASSYADNIRLPNIQTSGYAFTAGWGATTPTIFGTISSTQKQSPPTLRLKKTHNIGAPIPPRAVLPMEYTHNLHFCIKVQ